jgi:hypothetical protein
LQRSSNDPEFVLDFAKRLLQADQHGDIDDISTTSMVPATESSMSGTVPATLSG